MQWRLMGKREREMWQRAAGQIRTWAGHSQPRAIWLPAHPTEINQHPGIWCFVVLCQEQLILETILSFLVAFQLLHFFQPTLQVPIPSTRFPELESGVSTDWGGCCSKLGEHDTTECGWKWDIVTFICSSVNGGESNDLDSAGVQEECDNPQPLGVSAVVIVLLLVEVTGCMSYTWAQLVKRFITSYYLRFEPVSQAVTVRLKKKNKAQWELTGTVRVYTETNTQVSHHSQEWKKVLKMKRFHWIPAIMTLVDSKPSVDHPGNLRFMIRLNSDQSVFWNT